MQLYFDRRDQFDPSMRSSDTWSDNSDQVNIHVYSIEVRYLSIMSIVNPVQERIRIVSYIVFAKCICWQVKTLMSLHLRAG